MSERSSFELAKLQLNHSPEYIIDKNIIVLLIINQMLFHVNCFFDQQDTTITTHKKFIYLIGVGIYMFLSFRLSSLYVVVVVVVLCSCCCCCPFTITLIFKGLERAHRVCLNLQDVFISSCSMFDPKYLISHNLKKR